jgi:FG-GAP repeat
MTDGTAVTVGTVRASAGVFGRRNHLGGLVALLAAVILSTSGGGFRFTSSEAPGRDGLAALLRLPAAAQGPISAALGRDAADYRITGLTAANRAQRLSARFTVNGVVVHSGAARFSLGLSGLGRGDATREVAAAAPVTSGGSVLYARPGLRETWRNGPLGLEQSFVVAHGPAGAGAFTLAVSVPAGSRLVGRSIRLPGGLSYTGLRASDASGRVLRSWVQLRGDRALLHVDDAGAAYPITVDPFVQQAQLSEPSSTTNADEVGYSVAVSGSTVVVGASHATTGGDSAAGAAYVFQEGAGGWAKMTQTATLTPSDPLTVAQFGTSVAISGNTIVVGAPSPGEGDQQDSDNPCNLPAGNAYIYEMPAGGWKSATQTTELTPPVSFCLDPAFGYSVAVDGSTVVVGAPYWLASSEDAVPGGAAFVYTLSANGATTGSVATLTNAPASQGTNCPCALHYQEFGWSVGVSGSTIVVGAPGSNDPGAAYIYAKPAAGWATTSTPTSTLASTDVGPTDELGYSVAADGSTVVVAAPNHSGSDAANPGSVQHEGALYVFEQPAGGWPGSMTQNSELTPSDPTSVGNTTLGIGGVAISNSTIIGATDEGTGSLNAGAGYEFTEPAGGWPATMTQTQKLTLTTPENGFASAVGVSGTTVVLGAPGASPYGTAGTGGAYVFVPGTAATTTTIATTTVGKASAGHAKVSADFASAKLSCAGASGTNCRLALSLTSVETLNGHKLTAVTARASTKKAKRTKKTVTIGSAKLTLTGGATKTVKLSLNRTGKQLLAKFRALPAHLTITQTQATGKPKAISTQRITFHEAKRKTKKKGIDSTEIIQTVHSRPAPVISATAGLYAAR